MLSNGCDHRSLRQPGVLRYAGSDPSACLAYAELFGLEENDFTLVTLVDEADGSGSGTAQAA